MLKILYQIDPIGAHGQDNTEKFVPEAISILARLREARFVEDVETIVHRSCDGDSVVGDSPTKIPLRLTRATIAICSAWNRFLDESAR